MKDDTYKTVVIGFGALMFAMVGLWLYSRYSEIRGELIERMKSETAAHVRGRVAALLDARAFADAGASGQREIFQTFFSDIQSSKVAGIRAWDRNRGLRWSSLGASARERLPESPELLGALNGEVRFAIEKPRSRPFSKRPTDEWSETYVPISDAQGRVVGVIGVIQPTQTLREEVRSQFHRLVLPVGIFMFFGYGALLVLLHLMMAPKVPSAATNSTLAYSAKSQAPVPSAQSR